MSIIEPTNAKLEKTCKAERLGASFLGAFGAAFKRFFHVLYDVIFDKFFARFPVWGGARIYQQPCTTIYSLARKHKGTPQSHAMQFLVVGRVASA